MPNQHTLTIPLTQATERQLLVHIASRMENQMSDMSAALDRLSASLAKEIADIRDDLLAQVNQLGSVNAELRDQLAAKVGELDSAVARVEGMAADLDANDAPAPDPGQPVDPGVPGEGAAPEAPVDVPGQPGGDDVEPAPVTEQPTP